MWASAKGHAAIVEALIQAGADVDKALNNGTTALIWASEKGHAVIVEALIQAGADIDKADSNGNTALMFASEAGLGAIVEALIMQAGADVDMAMNNGAREVMVLSWRPSSRLGARQCGLKLASGGWSCCYRESLKGRGKKVTIL